MMSPKIPQNIEKYNSHYSERGLWSKIKSVAKKAGSKTIYMVLLLHYVLKSPDVSIKEKAKIYGALGYFILPIDLIPDAIPFVGYSDDITALASILHSVWKNVTPEIKQQAQQKLKDWFDNKEP
ncbi:MAG: DUF1232 domain-containing protein [Bacteroides sp.]|nr:DUF1232 domain-containing protein [Bacteroides sp.]